VTNETTRRDWLKATGLGIGGVIASSLLGGCAATGSSSARSAGRAGSIRVAHVTDVHVQNELGGARGMAAAFRHVQSRKRKPELILNTGDCVMDVLNRDRARATELWTLWSSVLKDECSTPIEHCLGNHDIWGWVKERSGTTGNEPGWGKKWAMDVLGLSRPYHAFDRGAWRIVMLDSVMPAAEGVWEARLDDEQFTWLEGELKATKRPVLVCSHVPIVSPAVFLDTGKIGGTPEAPALAVRRVHADVKRIGHLFAKYGNVKLCISGHLHEIDRAEFHGTTYITNPAVCGDWWKGHHRGVWDEQYTMLDLHADGSFDVEYVNYGWTPEAPPATAPATRADA